MKYLSKLGLTRVGVDVIDYFISSKLAFPSFFQVDTRFFFNIVVRGFTIEERLGMNLLTNLILPKKLYNPFLWLGSVRDRTASTLSGSIFNPFLDTICPMTFPWSVAYTHFLGFRDTPYSLHLSNTYIRLSK